MIEFGLARITRLLRHTPIKWAPIHVAGTNGKGSVCAYASAMLHANRIRCGRFTSPHLINRWDCVTIEERSVSSDLFQEVEAGIKADNALEGINATEFEVLTATAFQIFHRLQVEVGVIEVGMGGTHDATNVIQHPAVTVITKIALDHETYLGSSMEDIASHKAGIIKPHGPCLVDGTNTQSVIEVLKETAKDRGASLLQLVPQDLPLQEYEPEKESFWPALAPHQQMNILLALNAVEIILCGMGRSIPRRKLIAAARAAFWPGRLQEISLEGITHPGCDALLDGAHNPSAAEVLGKYVDERLRPLSPSVMWVIGMSSEKDARQILSYLLKDGDGMVAVDFGEVKGMPWVKPMDPAAIIAAAKSIFQLDQCESMSHNIRGALQEAVRIGGQRSIVITGSLYLVSDILRLKQLLGEHKPL